MTDRRRNNGLLRWIVVGTWLLLATAVVLSFVTNRAPNIDLLRELAILIATLLLGGAVADALRNWQAIISEIGQIADLLNQRAERQQESERAMGDRDDE